MNTTKERPHGTNRKNAVIAGILFIIGTVPAVITTAFLKPFLSDPDFFIKVFGNENQTIILRVFVQLIMAFACAGIAIALYPVLRKHNEALALGSVGFRIFENVLAGVSAISLLPLLTLSREYVNAGAPAVSYFQTLSALLLGAHASISNISLIPFCLGAMMYYYVFYRSKLIPRWLSGWGLIAIIMNLTSALLVLFALSAPFSTLQMILSLPILVQELVLAVWLIVKGFNPSAFASGVAKTPTNELLSAS
jgi:hypothetical protein